MKRSPIKRKTPLRSSGPVKTNSGLDRAGPRSSGKASQISSKRRKPSKRAVTAETAEAVLRRDGSCRAWALGFALDERCSGRNHIHHRVLRSQGGGHDESNLLVLCDLHHRLAHDHRRAEANETGVILSAHAG